MKKYSDPSDPKGLIFEAFRIPGITEKDCRTIFFDWALSIDKEKNPIDEIRHLYNKYSELDAGHPMNLVLKEGLEFKAHSRRRKKRT